MTALRAEGFGGQIEFDGELVKITREGRRAPGPNRTFKIEDVIRLKFSEPTRITNGFLTFVLPGIKTKLTEINTLEVAFSRKQGEAFSTLVEALQSYLDQRGELSAERIAELEPMYREGRDEANRENREASEQKIAHLRRKMLFGQYGGYVADHKGFRHVIGIKRDIAGATAEYESGADRSRPTLTRIGAGALLAGPVGAIAGGMFQKDRTKGYVTVIFPDGATVIIDGPAKDEKKMREFASAINMISEMEQSIAGTSSEPVEAGETGDATADQLLKLKQLLDAGVLTEEQYAEKSAPLIAAL